jgi:hypothetical protein
VEPDQSLNVLFDIPDPENKLRVVIRRNMDGAPGEESEAQLRNAAMALDPRADYYLIVDSDEIWPGEVLRQCWEEVQRTRAAGYRVSTRAYFKTWNYRIVEPGDGYRPIVFVRRGFPFKAGRQVNWRGLPRLKEILRRGHKPRTVYFPTDWILHHGSCVGCDARITTKLTNFGHADAVDPTWFERIWVQFHPGIRDFHFLSGRGRLFESLLAIPTPQLPAEITSRAWPEGWIDAPATRFSP